MRVSACWTLPAGIVARTAARRLGVGGYVVGVDIARERAAEAAMLQQAATLRAAGFSGCEIERWASDQGFVGSQLSEASGIPLNELQAGKCLSAEPSQKEPTGHR